MRQISTLFFLFCLSVLVFAQDEPSFDDDAGFEEVEEQVLPELEQTLETEVEEEAGTEIEIVESEASAEEFDVFRPSEDISEDLAVPFPADI